MTQVGIIGCGNISRFHHEGLSKAGARIARVCDVRSEAAAAVGRLYDARVSTDWRAVLDDPSVDLVSVLAPASLHRDICLAAIGAGKGVICEKTLSDSAGASLKIAKAANRSGLFFATAFMKRHFPASKKAKTLLAEMGPVLSIHARTWQPYFGLWEGTMPDSWHEKPSPVVRTYGGGVLVCGGSHILDLIQWFGGRPTRAAGMMNIPADTDFDIHTNALLTLPTGGAVHLECFWHPFRHIGFARDGWDERLEINTAAGRLSLYTVMWDQPEKIGALLVHDDALSGRSTEYRYPAENAFHVEMAALLRQFEQGESASPSAGDGYAVDQVIESITRSAKSGQVVDIEYGDIC